LQYISDYSGLEAEAAESEEEEVEEGFVMETDILGGNIDIIAQLDM